MITQRACKSSRLVLNSTLRLTGSSSAQLLGSTEHNVTSIGSGTDASAIGPFYSHIRVVFTATRRYCRVAAPSRRLRAQFCLVWVAGSVSPRACSRSRPSPRVVSGALVHSTLHSHCFFGLSRGHAVGGVLAAPRDSSPAGGSHLARAVAPTTPASPVPSALLLSSYTPPLPHAHARFARARGGPTTASLSTRARHLFSESGSRLDP